MQLLTPALGEDLVQEWQRNTLPMLKPIFHPSLDFLIEHSDEDGGTHEYGQKHDISTSFPYMVEHDYILLSHPEPSESQSEQLSDLTPSLCSDTASDVSTDCPSTKSSHASIGLVEKKESYRRPVFIAPSRVEEHPLEFESLLDQEEVPLDIAISIPIASTTRESRYRIRSNISSSFHNLKSRAMSSLQSLPFSCNPSITPTHHQPRNSWPSSQNNRAWLHPWLFIRLRPETRPKPFRDPPTSRERQYFNPTILSLDEQRKSFCQVLHPTVPMETNAGDTPLINMHDLNNHIDSNHDSEITDLIYTDTGRGNIANDEIISTDSLHTTINLSRVRQREPRENSEFLRVVVLEMNMRRNGKLEDGTGGRARVWLPPRMTPVATDRLHDFSTSGGVPSRWIGITPDNIVA